MQIFFESTGQIEAFLDGLHRLSCPCCGASETLVRHGYIRGYVSPRRRGIRARRIHCKRARGGCGAAPSIRLADGLLNRCFSTAALWGFLLGLLEAHSVKAAWERSGIGLCLDSAYRLLRQLHRIQSVLRSRLHARAPPPEGKIGAGSPLRQVLEHLRSAFGDTDAISVYQHVLQKDFLAIS